MGTTGVYDRAADEFEGKAPPKFAMELLPAPKWKLRLARGVLSMAS